MRKGRANPRSKYGDFIAAIDKAISSSELKDLQTIERNATGPAGNWKAAAWRLERKFPRKWGRLDRIETTGTEGGPQVVISLPAKDPVAPGNEEPSGGE